MKCWLVILVLLGLNANANVSPTSLSTSLTFQSAYMSKSVMDGEVLYSVIRDLNSFCLDVGNGMQFGSYQLAVDFDNLDMALYQCDGQFVQTPGQSLVVVFSFANCTKVDPVALRKTCPPAPSGKKP
jgi:hypothetical protein